MWLSANFPFADSKHIYYAHCLELVFKSCRFLPIFCGFIAANESLYFSVALKNVSTYLLMEIIPF